MPQSTDFLRRSIGTPTKATGLSTALNKPELESMGASVASLAVFGAGMGSTAVVTRASSEWSVGSAVIADNIVNIGRMMEKRRAR